MRTVYNEGQELCKKKHYSFTASFNKYFFFFPKQPLFALIINKFALIWKTNVSLMQI